MITVLLIVVLLILVMCRRMSNYNTGRVALTWTNQNGITNVVEKWILTVKADDETFKAENTVDISDGDRVEMAIDNLPYKGRYEYNLSYKRIGSPSMFTIQESFINNQEKLMLKTENIASQSVNYDVDCIANYHEDICPATPGNNEPGCGTRSKTTRRWNIIQKSQANGIACPPEFEEVECGQINPCGTCVEQEWSEWSPCSPEFGNRSRTREATQEMYGGCLGDTSKLAVQEIQQCPVDCKGQWDCGSCGLAPDKSENDGSQMEKTCTWTTTVYPKNGGLACPSETKIIVSSEDSEVTLPDGSSQSFGKCPAPEPCTQSYSDGDCGAEPCGGNQRYKTRTYSQSDNPKYNGTYCSKKEGEQEKIECGKSPACPPPPPPPPAPSDYFWNTCEDLGGGSDEIPASGKDDCLDKCRNNTYEGTYGYKCKAVMYGDWGSKGHYCRIYNNADLDPGSDNCPDGISTFVLK